MARADSRHYGEPLCMADSRARISLPKPEDGTAALWSLSRFPFGEGTHLCTRYINYLG